MGGAGGEEAARPEGVLRWTLAWSATGLLHALSFPPLAFDLLILLAFVPVLVGAARLGPRGFLRGFLVGQALIGGHQLFWISAMSNVGALSWGGWIAISLLYLVLSLPLGGGLRQVLRRRRWPFWLALAIAVPGHEILREGLLSGLSWASPGYALGNRPLLIQLAALGDVHLVSLAVLLVNGAVAAALTRREPAGGGVKALLAGLAAVLVVLVHGAASMAGVETRTEASSGPRLLGIQPNITLEERDAVKARGEAPSWHFLERQLELVERGLAAAPGPVDLVVWPETSVPPLDESLRARRVVGFPPDRLFAASGRWSLAPRFAAASRRAGKEPTRHLIGLQLYSDRAAKEEAASRFGHAERNATLLLAPGPEGGLREEDRYAKSRLVPFGERVPDLPFRESLKGLIDSRAGFAPSLTPGTESGVMRLPGSEVSEHAETSFGVSICYEIIFPRLFAEQRRRGADFFVNVSNDVWYGDSAEMELVHLALRFRAVENRRAVFRCGNTGISALLDPTGRERAVVEEKGRRQHVRGTLVGRIPVGGQEPGPDFLRSALRLVLAGAALLGALRAGFGKSFRTRDLGFEH